MRNNSVKRGNIFESIQAIKTPLSRHNLSYTTKIDCEMGEIIPFYKQKVCPGVNMMASAGLFGRMMPTISPIMDDVDLEVRYFFVPNRLLWDNFEDYITKKDDYVHPFIPIQHEDLNNIPYLMDLLSNVGNEAATSPSGQYDYVLAIDELPYRAYYLIYNEYFRDENIQNEVEISKNDGNTIDATELTIMYADWKKDYFTSALPWTQRGNMAQFVGDVFLNNNNTLPQLIKQRGNHDSVFIGNLNFSEIVDDDYYGTMPQRKQIVNIGVDKGDGNLGNSENALGVRYISEDMGASSISQAYDAVLDPNGTLSVSFGINELRMANAVQRYLERSALAGNRYTEYIMGMFGVHCADSRLQRPEYLGGCKVPFIVQEVMQNEQAQLDSSGDAYDSSTPQGNLAGIGRLQAYAGFNKEEFFPEYGIVIGVMYLRPKASYMNGVPRSEIIGALYTGEGGGLVAMDSMDIYYNPFFEHLGEEAVYNIELFADGEACDDFGAALAGQTSFDKEIFGYQSRNAFRKFRHNEIHGEFRSTLKHWHLGREFANKQTLSDGFLKCNPSKRIFAVEDDSNHFIFDIYNKVDAVLPMSAYGTPML